MSYKTIISVLRESKSGSSGINIRISKEFYNDLQKIRKELNKQGLDMSLVQITMFMHNLINREVVKNNKTLLEIALEKLKKL